MNKKDILILGAGPAGMTAAYELANSGIKSSIIEKEERVGGFGKTLVFKEGNLVFKTDIGPHRFFSQNKFLYDFIESLLHEKWKLVNRQTRQFIGGKFYDYPINATQALKNLGIIKDIGVATSYFSSFVTYHIFRKKIKNFEDYILANFGRVLGELNMLNYTEKIWGIPCSTIHSDWAKQRIKGLNLISAVKNAIFKGKSEEGPKTLIDSFYYPDEGTGLIYDAIASNVKKKGTKIYTRSYPTKIKHRENRIKEVELLINGKKKIVKPEILVESIPITDFVSLLEPKAPKDVLDALNKLKWRSQVYLFITLDKERVTKDNWIYFPDKEIPFGRMMEPKNFSAKLVPKGKTSLFVEFFVFENDKVWNLSKDELFELTIKQLEKLGFIKRKDVRSYYLIKRKNVYPVYDLEYHKYLDKVRNYLNKFSNLYYIGRAGRFKYNNQDHSLEMGFLAARSIIENKKYSIEKTASEQEYFEKGVIKEIGANPMERQSYIWMILEDRGDEEDGEKNEKKN